MSGYPTPVYGPQIFLRTQHNKGKEKEVDKATIPRDRERSKKLHCTKSALHPLGKKTFKRKRKILMRQWKEKPGYCKQIEEAVPWQLYRQGCTTSCKNFHPRENELVEEINNCQSASNIGKSRGFREWILSSIRKLLQFQNA